MSSYISYRKEFEDIIIKGKLDEALKTLVPNSQEKFYVEFCEEFKKCQSQKKITKELNSILENARKVGLSNKFIEILETRRDLLEYDLPSTSADKKNQIINNLFRIYCNAIRIYRCIFGRTARDKRCKNGATNKSN